MKRAPSSSAPSSSSATPSSSAPPAGAPAASTSSAPPATPSSSATPSGAPAASRRARRVSPRPAPSASPRPRVPILSRGVTVAVTGLNATDNPAPGPGVIRSLRAAGDFCGRVVGLAYDALDTAAYDADLVDEVHLIPYPGAGEETVLRRLRQIHRQTPIDVLIPTLDSELLNFVHLEPQLSAMGIRTLLPSEDGLRLRAKLALYEFCAAHDFNSPRTVTLTRPEAARRLPFAWPAAIKGMFHGASIAHNAEEAVVGFERMKSRWGLPVLAQQFVDGEEYDVLMLGDRDGRLVGSVPMRKLGITDQGKAWSGITISDPALDALATRIFEALRWSGPLELEFVRDRRSGDFHLIEINPRFPSWCYLTVGAGLNLPLAAARLALGETLEPMEEPAAGVTFVRHAVDLVCSLEWLERLVVAGSLVHRGRGGPVTAPAATA